MPIASELTIDNTASALTLAQTIFGAGVTVTSATLTGAATQSGTFTGGDATLGDISVADTGIILSTGDVASFTNSSGTLDTNTAAGTSTDHGGAGDADLDTVSGQTTFDAVVLNTNFTATSAGYVTMQFTFSSEEYLEYVSGGVNDAFGVWVNGTYVPFTPATNDLVSIDTINNTSSSNLYVDNPAATDPYNTEMDGTTITLSIKAPIVAGANTMKIALADGGDSAFDSNVLIAANSVQTFALAFDDTVTMLPNTSVMVDVLANDTDQTGGGLTVTEINGNAISVGSPVTLPTGETITLNPNGTLTVTSDADISSEVFTYTVEDSAGNTDVGFLTINTVATLPSDYIVSGTAGGDTINSGYVGDPDGDLVDNLDNFDATNNDSIEAGGGNDLIDSGAGSDTILAGSGDDTVMGNAGADVIRGEGGSDVLDYSTSGAGVSVDLTEQDTNDIGGGITAAVGSGGDADGDIIRGMDNLVGSGFDDTLTLNDFADGTFVTAGAGDDSVTGSIFNNTLDGGAGSDTVYGMGGDDTISGGSGSDTIYGDTGAGGVELITNGSFEDGTHAANGVNGLTGWSNTSGSPDSADDGTTAESWNPDNAASDGTGYITMWANSTGPNEAMQQTLATPLDAGTSYTLSLNAISADRIGGQWFTPTDIPVEFELVDQATGTVLGSVTVQGTSYESYSFDFTPTSSVSTIIIRPNTAGTGTYPSLVIDELSLMETADLGASNDDSIFAGSGDDIVFGEQGDDTIFGQDGSDTLIGGAGNDTLDGDDASATGGADSIDGGAGNDQIIGDVGNDTLIGGIGGDTIFAGSDDDSILGGAGDDSMFGEGGDDTFTLEDGFGTDTIFGGETGETDGDTLDLQSLTQDTTVYLTSSDPEAGSILSGSDAVTFVEIENIILGDGRDTIVLADGSGDDTVQAFDMTDSGDGTTLDQLNVAGLTSDGGTTPVTTADVTVTDDGSGNAVLSFPGGESITLIGVAPSQVDTPAELEAIGIPAGPGPVDGTAGDDVMGISYTDTDGDIIDGADGLNDTIYGYAGNDSIDGGFGDDTIDGGTGDDTLFGDAGDDSVLGGDGDDDLMVEGTLDNDTLVGGEGGETAAGDSLNTDGVADDLTVTFTGAEQGTITDGTSTTQFSEVEDLLLGSGSDTVTGGAGDERVWAGAGDDVLNGGAGSDTLQGAAGNDSLSGGDGADLLHGWEDVDTLDGGDGNDTLLGGDGADTFIDGAGDDSLDGGEGKDRFDYTTITGNDTVIGGEVNDTTPTDSGDKLDAHNSTDNLTVTFTGDEAGTMTDGTNTVTFSEIEHIMGGQGTDSIDASASTVQQILDGGEGADTIQGGSGDDIIAMGLTQDFSATDGDDDTLVLVDGFGNDSIEGFETPTDLGGGVYSGNDQLDVTGLTDAGGNPVNVDDVTVTDTNGDGTGDAILQFPNGESITLWGVPTSAVSTDEQLVAMGIPAASGTVTIHDAIQLSGGTPLSGTTLTTAGGDFVEVDEPLVFNVASGSFIAPGDTTTIDGTLYTVTAVNIIEGNYVYDDGATTTGTKSYELVLSDGLGGTLDYIIPTDDMGARADITEIEVFSIAADTNVDVDAVDADNNVTLSLPLDYIVEGTAGADTINAGYTGDPEGDMVDNNDHIDGSNDDSIQGFDGNDSISGGLGNDTIDAGADNDTVLGGSGNDSILGGTGDDAIYAEDGNDTVYAGDGNDTVGASTGADLIYGEGGNDSLVGGGFASTGHDTIYGGTGDDTIEGGLGNDSLFGDEDNDSLVGDAGNDTLEGGIGDDTLIGGDGADSMNGDIGNDSLVAGAGDDFLRGSFGEDTLIGGTGNDTLWGGFGDDSIVIDANFGDYTVDGEADAETNGDTMDASGVTNDLTWDLSNVNPENGSFTDGTNTATFTDIENIILGSGTDTLVLSTFGGSERVIGFEAPTDTGGGTFSGNDLLDVSGLTDFDGNPTHTGNVTVSDDGSGNAVLTFGNGETLTLVGVAPADVATPAQLIAMGIPEGPDGYVDGTAGDDVIDVTYTGDPNFDMIDNTDAQLPGAAPDDDYVRAGAGNDSVLSNAGDDTVELDAGNDTADGGIGDDTIDGGTGNDSIIGGLGNDSLVGGTGDDTLNGQLGDDTMEGGDGSDTFALEDDYGNDVIIGGEVDDAAGDTLDLSGLGGGHTFDLTGTDSEAGTVTDGTSTITFSEIENIELSAGIDTIVLDNGSGDDTVSGFAAPFDDGFGTWVGIDQVDVSTMIDGNGAPVNTGDVTVTDDGSGNAVLNFPGGESLTLIGVPPTAFPVPEALAAIGIPLADYIVEGTAAGELIDGSYLGDPEGDIVDAGDGDPLLANADSDSIEAGGGDDTVRAGAGDDTVYGGTGNDQLEGGIGDDTLIGEEGNDLIFGGAGNDSVLGGDGNDIINGMTGSDFLEGGADADTFVVEDGFGTDTIVGGETATTGTDFDVINVNSASVLDPVTVIYSGDEAGTLSDGTDTLEFSEIESLQLSDAGDTVDATSDGVGVDIDAAGGDDTVTGGTGSDTIEGGTGNDVISGGENGDSIIAGAGDDTINVAQGDTVTGGDGDDFFNIVDLGEIDTDTITITGGEGGETDGDTLALNGLHDRDSLVITDPDDVNGGLSGTVTLLDGTVINFTNIENIICFVAGTEIATPYGGRKIEDLRVGDHVVTQDNGIQAIRWIGTSTVPASGDFAPVRFAAKAFPGASGDLVVSPQHRMLFKGYEAELLFGESEVLIPALHLVDGHAVTREAQAEITYIHIMFEQHEIVFAQGVATESFHPGAYGVGSLAPKARDELFTLFPELRSAMNSYGPSARSVLRAHESKLLLEY